MFHFNPVTRSVEPFKDPLIYQNIHGLCLDDDALWVGTFSQGLNKIDLRTRKVKHYAHLPKNIFSVFRTTSGQLYLGTPSGLISYDSEKDTFSSVPELSGLFITLPRINRETCGLRLMLTAFTDRIFGRRNGNILCTMRISRAVFLQIKYLLSL